jgi:hypothetical protein
MLIIYPKVSKAKIGKEAAQAISKVRKWFASHPEREDCVIQAWYGEVVRVTREDFEAKIGEAADKARAKA